MSPEDEVERQVLVTYKGLPHQTHDPVERGKWSRFVDFITPWLRRKRQLGDEFLEAKVMQERASAMKTLSEAVRNMAEAKKIAAETADIAARIDEKNAKMNRAVTELLSVAEMERAVEDDLATLEEKMKEAHFLHGTRILALDNKPVPEEPL